MSPTDIKAAVYQFSLEMDPRWDIKGFANTLCSTCWSRLIAGFTHLWNVLWPRCVCGLLPPGLSFSLFHGSSKCGPATVKSSLL